MDARLPYIPETVTVHLGAPTENAPNVTLPFVDYIANVASSEIYPTWPESAIRANIYAQISFALNRIYTEYYRVRGYDFDITNSTAIDQYFVDGRDIYENISQIVSEIFDTYIVRRGSVEPLFAQFCNGTTVTCAGLSQWGSVSLANEGYTPYEILQYYYGEDIDLREDTPVMGITSSLPDRLLRLGTAGDDVRQIQIRLNRISANYPSIPKIAIPDGVFSFDTEDAVRRFQEVFSLPADGIVGKSTWYAIQFIYNAVKRLSELNSEGIALSEVTQQYGGPLSEGSVGLEVQNVQYLLSYLSEFYNTIPPVSIDGVFGPATTAAVAAFQSTFELPVTGEFGFDDWDVLYRTYLGFLETIPFEYVEGNVLPYPGIPLRLGSQDDSVRVLQEYLNFISGSIDEIPSVSVTGYFGEQTQSAVLSAQRFLGIPDNGTVGSVTWNGIADLYDDLYRGSRLGEGQYPGYDVGR
ncbi:MAG: peptidoglycan-binding protein [Clostridia bacterium]|nr:peptidoglycan-binding protein [Clostridia bacterium]